MGQTRLLFQGRTFFNKRKLTQGKQNSFEIQNIIVTLYIEQHVRRISRKGQKKEK